MSVPLSTIFQGDVTLQEGSDVSLFGFGDLNVKRNVIINGIQNSISNTDGALVVAGGVGISKTLNVNENLNVLYGTTSLTKTFIDTSNGVFNVSGGNGINVSVGNTINLNTINTLNIFGNTSVNIQSTNGSINTLSKMLNINTNESLFNVNTSQGNQNMVFSLNGNTNSQILLTSSGTQDAIRINTTNTQGNINISNNEGLGGGSINVLSGNGGIKLISNTLGNINLKSQSGNVNIDVDSAQSGNNLNISMNNKTDSAIIIKSDGNNFTQDAIQIKTNNTNGNITLSQIVNSLGSTNIFPGSGGLNVTTQTGGAISLNAYSSLSNFTNYTTADNQNLVLSVQGNTLSKVDIKSSGRGVDSVSLSTTNSGGILINSSDIVQIESNNKVSGVSIATQNQMTPVYIGTNNSTTTIYGNLDVKGTTTTIESNVVTITDNIIVVNNAPSGTSDGGLAVKRYQYSNDTRQGDVIKDVPESPGTVQDNFNTLTTIHLDSNASNIDGFYNDWWILVTSGTGANQVRKIKTYDANTKVATIYSTLDQNAKVFPIEGLDLSTVLDSTSEYALYPCHYTVMLWDESLDEFSFVCSSKNPIEQTEIVHYSDIHVNNIKSNDIICNNINGATADYSLIVTLDNSNFIPVEIPLQKMYGVFTLHIRPLHSNETDRCHAIFNIGRIDKTGLPGTVVRIISAKGAYQDQLDIQWSADSNPKLFYRQKPDGLSGFTDFKIKVSTV